MVDLNLIEPVNWYYVFAPKIFTPKMNLRYNFMPKTRIMIIVMLRVRVRVRVRLKI